MTSAMINWIATAWDALQNNSGFMTWNLFLALVPLGLSFWLFHLPRSRTLRWGVPLLIGATFLPNAQRVFRHGFYLLQKMGANYLFWVLLLTLVVMALEIWQLRRQESVSRSLLWWLGFVTFVAFLPNAPYVLTDVIHLIEDIRQGYSVWIITLALIPQYLLFTIIGFEAYVVSLIHLGYYLKRWGWGQFVGPAELLLHGLTAIGIHLGRFQRFNSWDILTDPDALVRSVMNDLVGKRPAVVMAVTFVVITVLYWLCKELTLAVLHRQQSATDRIEAIADSESSQAHS